MSSTLGTIRENIRRNLSDTNSAQYFYTNAELNQYIGEAYKKYSMIMIDEGEGFFETSINVGTTAGNPLISVNALTPPFYTISQFERWLSNGSSVPLKLSERRFKINTTIAVATGDAYRPTYKQRGMNIVLEPTPTGTEAPVSTGTANTGFKLDYNYIPTYPVAGSSDSFTFDNNFPIIWEPLIELWSTLRALSAKDVTGGLSDSSSFREQLAGLEQNFMDSLERDETPESVEQMGLDYSANLFSGGGWY